MHIEFDRAVDTFIGYLSEQFAKIQSEIPKWLGFFGLAGAKLKKESLMKKVRPYLEMFGVLDGNMVDIDMLKKALGLAFEKVPNLKYLNFTFDASDADGLVAKMQGVASSEVQQPQATAESAEVEE